MIFRRQMQGVLNQWKEWSNNSFSKSIFNLKFMVGGEAMCNAMFKYLFMKSTFRITIGEFHFKNKFKQPPYTFRLKYESTVR